MSPTVCRGSSDAYGSWKIIATSRRSARSFSPRRCVMSSPLNAILPAVGSISLIAVRPSVDLPQPDSPTSPSVSPVLISRSTPSTACTCPTVRCKTPEATGNHTFRSLIETSGSADVHARVRVLTAVSGTLELHAGLGDPARGALGVADRLQVRRVPRAAVDAEGTAGMEGAAFRQVDQAWGQTLDRLQGLVAFGVEARDRPQEGPGVGMLRMRKDVGRGAGLDDAACVHHDHALAHPGDYSEVVRDEHGRGPELSVDVAQQVEDLGLDSDVKCGGRLVRDQHRRRGGEAHRDHHALAHAARELVRVVTRTLRR